MNPLVSVIIPAYNASEYIVEALDSVLASEYRPLEVIVMEDGGQDDTLAKAQAFAEQHLEVKVYSQPNNGPSAARNNAIKQSHGIYILPVDADNIIDPRYIPEAVSVLETQPEVKVVSCRADFFGDRTGEWKFPKFSKRLLARKNMIDTCAMYRRADYDLTTGYMENCVAREDWDFWLSIFEHGGEFVRLPDIRLHYRVRAGSKRITDRLLKRQVVDAVNLRHPDYMQRYLGGPLHYHRSWSCFLNFFRCEKIVGYFRHWSEGRIIYDKRNILRVYQDKVVKSFAVPPLWRGIIYGMFAKSKARRSYEYALRMPGLTPSPLAYREVRVLGILRESAYVCYLAPCKYIFNDLIGNKDFRYREKILQAIGRFTATLHQHGILHRDYSGGNILFNHDGSLVQVIDLNRIRFKRINKYERLRNFERLNIDRDALTVMVTAYAEAMHEDAEYDCQYVIAHRWYKHVKQGITHLDD